MILFPALYREQAVAATIARIILAAIAIVVLLPLTGLLPTSHGFSYFLFQRQDILVLLLLFALLTNMQRDDGSSLPGSISTYFSNSPVLWYCIAPAALTLLCYAGHYLLFEDYDLSRDEQMANFDSWIFRHGQLLWPIPQPWHSVAPALNQSFVLPIGDSEAWLSTYLPVNAVLRTMIGMLADQQLTSPLLVAIGLIALWRISLKLFPDAPATQNIVLLLYLCSSQVFFTAMTSYAMTGHLALNLIWLLLFLKDRPIFHAAAILVGFLATGLHQPLFHPLFVIPFLWLMFRQKRFALLATYCVTYGAIGLFWLGWPIWISSHATSYVPIRGDEASSYWGRLAIMWNGFGLQSLYLMILNLVRFVAWQHLLLIPLMITGILRAWHGTPLVRTFTIGFLLPIAVMLLLLPYQGHGWGYRYLHGVIGNACLLAGYGWRTLEEAGISLSRACNRATAITLLVVFPYHAFLIHQIVSPYAKISRAINASDADIAIIEDNSAPFAQDLVLNRPDLSNRPIRLASSALTPSDIRQLCHRKRFVLLGDQQLMPINRYFGMSVPQNDKEGVVLRAAIRACGSPAKSPEPEGENP